MPDTSLAEKDLFILERRFGNADEARVEFTEFILLDVNGEYWFYPGFTQETDWQEESLNPGQYGYDVLLSFTWPSGVGEFKDIRFWGACFDSASYELLNWDMVEWSSADQL